MESNTNQKEFPFVKAEIFSNSSDMLEPIQERCRNVSLFMQKTLGKNLLCILFQGSSMRGDAIEGKSDFDFICMIKKNNPKTRESFTQIKQEFPDSNFLYITEDEYRVYPPNLRWQFFITRKIYGHYDFGEFPSQTEIIDTLVQNAIRLKNTLRPLALDIENDPYNKQLLEIVHYNLKRLDDCFIRIYCLYKLGEYPLTRHDLRVVSQSSSVNRITQLLDIWYSGCYDVEEVLDAFEIGGRLINIFLRKISKIIDL